MRHTIGPASLCLLLATSFVITAGAQEASDTRSADSVSSDRPSNMSTNVLSATKAYPPTLKLKQLDSKWRRFTASGEESDTNPNNMGMRMMMRSRALESLGIGVYYTKGDSVKIGDQTYLVSYTIDNEMDQQEMQEAFQELFGHGHGQPEVRDAKFLPDTKLTLSLSNIGTMGSLEDVTKFDPAREIMGAGDITALSTNNLRRLSQLLQQRGRHQALPLKDVRTMQEALQEQAHRRLPRLIVHPTTKEAYRPNTKLAGKRLNHIGNRAKVVAIYEARPGTDGKRGVAYLDGRVERIPEVNFNRIVQVAPQGPTAQQIHTVSAQNMQRLQRILLQYAQSRGTFPDMKNNQALQRTLRNWGGHEPDMYLHPKTRQPYRGNPALSNKRLADITNRSQVVAIYEATPGSDGKIGAVFLDRRVERIAPARWKRVIAVTPKMKAPARTAGRRIGRAAPAPGIATAGF